MMDTNSSSDLPGQLHCGKTARPGRVNMSDSEMQALKSKDFNGPQGKRNLEVKGATRPAHGPQ
ncbi:MAG: hypothetical protein KA385_13520 [Vicinamibacteria bacterium]|nr:hypothetical protein [Vicinamibacteria bacterium]